MGMLQKVSSWLTDKGEKNARGGDANRTTGNAYFAPSGAEQASGGMRASTRDAQAATDPRMQGSDTGRRAPADPSGGEANDKYGGRVPYRSQRDLQAEADAQRMQQDEQLRRQASAQQQQRAQQFGRGNPAQQPVAYQQPSNIVPFPGMIRGPEGNLYAHVEYVLMLHSREECPRVIEYIKANASVFLTMEFIADENERQRCMDMLSGAAYTLGCRLNKISRRGIYLISSPSVYVVMDPAVQKFAAMPETPSYGRVDYAPQQGYGAGAQAGYGGVRQDGYAPQGGGQNAYRPPQPQDRAAAYRSPQSGGGQSAYSPQQSQERPSAAYRSPQGGGQTAYAPAQAAGQQNTGNWAQPVAPAGYPPQQSMGFASGQQPGAFAQQGVAQAGGSRTAYPQQQGAAQAYPQQTNPGNAYAPRPGYPPNPTGVQTAPYAAQSGPHTAPYPPQRGAGYPPAAGSGAGQPPVTPPSRRAGAPFGMQGAFVKSAEGAQAGR